VFGLVNQLYVWFKTQRNAGAHVFKMPLSNRRAGRLGNSSHWLPVKYNRQLNRTIAAAALYHGAAHYKTPRGCRIIPSSAR